MASNDSSTVRRTFLDYFAKQGHKPVASASLVPHNDPTLLFTNAGMNQFKDYFTRKAQPPFPRATSAQKLSLSPSEMTRSSPTPATFFHSARASSSDSCTV